MPQDFILDATPHGSMAQFMLNNDMDPGCARPFIDNDGKAYIVRKVVRNGKVLRKKQRIATNAATLRRDEWLLIDRTMVDCARPQLQFFNDVRSANSFVIPQGLGKSVLISQSSSDITPAVISMDGLKKSDSDRIHYDTVGHPLPIFTKDFFLSMREVWESRNGGPGLDVQLLGAGGIKIGEEIEKVAIGTGLGMRYAGYPLYGATNFPNRLTYDISTPGDTGWTPKTLITDIVGMRQMSIDNGYRGPWNVYFATEWAQHLDLDYSDAKGDNTLRQRVAALDRIGKISTLDFLPSWDILMVMMDPRVCRAVICSDVQTITWEQSGGWELCLRVYAAMTTQWRNDFYGNTGVVHGSETPPSS